MADQSGYVKQTLDLAEGLKDAQYVHTDTWMDMEFFQNGKIKPEYAAEFEKRKAMFEPYQLNAALINKYCSQAKPMHCMPCHVDYEITSDAINHPNTLIFDQAENRMHIQKAIMIWLLRINGLLN